MFFQNLQSSVLTYLPSHTSQYYLIDYFISQTTALINHMFHVSVLNMLPLLAKIPFLFLVVKVYLSFKT